MNASSDFLLKHLYRISLSPILFIQLACTGSITDSMKEYTKFETSIQAANALSASSITITSNTTTQQATCASGNTIVLQVSIPQNKPAFCRDRSTLMEGAITGPVCEGGVTIVGISANNKAVACQQLTVCGITATSSVAIGQRADGGTIQELTFQNLPWACAAQLDYSQSAAFDADATETVGFQVVPPACPFCPRANRASCLSCSALTPNETLVSGQVIPRTCSGTACANCDVEIGSISIPVNHGSGRTFYKKESATCGRKCADDSMLRICNNGYFEGSTQFSFSECRDTACGCKLPNSTLTFDSGKIISLFANDKPVCGQTCSGVQVRCLDGDWFRVSNNQKMTTAELEALPKASCTDPACNCMRDGRRTVTNNSTAIVYSQGSVPCGSTCTPYQGTIECKDGALKAANASHLSFTFDTCAPQQCGCNLPSGGFILEGATRTLYSQEATTCDQPDACDEVSNKASVTCTKGSLSTYDSARFRYQSCTAPICFCNAPSGQRVTIGSKGYFYSTKKPASGISCKSTSIEVECKSNGLFAPVDVSKNISSYPYDQCYSDLDEGNLGGTGGGVGDGEGPGSALRRKLPGGGGGGGGNVPAPNYTLNINFRDYVSRHPCVLPWGDGELEFYGSVMMFNQECATLPDRCSKHAKSRTCHDGGWTGSSSYRYKNCVEKSSCP